MPLLDAPAVTGDAPPPRLTVYYDGACPVCRREVAQYQRGAGGAACDWVDAAHCARDALGPDLDRAQALARLHVRQADGRLLQGAAGFAALWQALPGWRWLGRLVDAPPVRPLAALGYSLFLRLRPLWRPAAPPPQPASTVRAAERARFNALADTWWDPAGPMRPLHAVNALRLDTVVQQVLAHAGRTAAQGLGGLRILDVGCGAGLVSEPLARLGAQVTGLDAAERNIAIARAHAQARGVAVDYRCGEPAAALRPDERFDVLLLLEVVEHVADVRAFVAQAAGHLAPGGLVIASTINRSAKSFVFAIVGAEWVLRLLPRGTHRWRQFVTPAELAAAMAGQGLRPLQLRGMRYQPLGHRAAWCDDTRVNYLASFASLPPAAAPDRAVGLFPLSPALDTTP